MVKLIKSPTIIKAAGVGEKRIEEYIGRVNSRIQYSTPFEGGAEYIAVCLPAFSPDTVNRDK